MGEGAVDDRPATCRNAQSGLLSQGLEDISHGQRRRASLTGQVAGAHQLFGGKTQLHRLLFFHLFTPIQVMSSSGLSLAMVSRALSLYVSGVISRPPGPVMYT